MRPASEISRNSNATPAAFYELYDAAARALKAHNASLTVGGPGVASALRDTNYSFGLIDHVAASGAPLDFFSFHGYGTHAARPTALFAPMAAALRARLDGERGRQRSLGLGQLRRSAEGVVAAERVG